MTTGTALLVSATRVLRAAGVDDPATDARVLLAYALGMDRDRLTLVLPDDVPENAETVFLRAVEARTNRQPVAQIIGQRGFYGRDFLVTSDVLDPRPETELLVDTALEHPFETVVDMGTGTGCILLTLLAENNSATGVGTDLSPGAIEVAAHNAKTLGLADRVRLFEGSWFEAIPAGARFDLIASNPPYITADEMRDLAPDVRDWEPHLALTPGGDGLSAYWAITRQAAEYLAPNGRLIVEIGAAQGADVQAMFQAAGFTSIRVLKDLAGHDRVVMGYLSESA